MQRNNSSFYAVLSVLIAVGAFLYCWKMVIPDYNKTKKEISTVESDASFAKKKLESLQTAKRELDSISTVVDGLFVAIPEGTDAPNLITELEAIATKNKTYFPTIQIDDDEPSGTTVGVATSSANSIKVSVTAEGTFEDINALITDLEKDIRFMNIKSTALTATDKALSVSIRFEAYKRISSSSAAN